MPPEPSHSNVLRAVEAGTQQEIHASPTVFLVDSQGSIRQIVRDKPLAMVVWDVLAELEGALPPPWLPIVALTMV